MNLFIHLKLQLTSLFATNDFVGNFLTSDIMETARSGRTRSMMHTGYPYFLYVHSNLEPPDHGLFIFFYGMHVMFAYIALVEIDALFAIHSNTISLGPTRISPSDNGNLTLTLTLTLTLIPSDNGKAYTEDEFKSSNKEFWMDIEPLFLQHFGLVRAEEGGEENNSQGAHMQRETVACKGCAK